MAKYLRLFQTTAEYTTAESTLDKPNVSYCVDNNEVHYKPYIPPQPIIYEASAKLAETTVQGSSGLHTNAFNTTIKSHTFENGVGTIEFNDNVTSIGSFAFRGCTGLTSITIPNSITSISNSAFTGCSGLTSIIIPDSVTSIGNYAFNGCTGLTSINIPDSVTSIGMYAFNGCTNLASIEISDSVTSIGNNAFLNCTALTNVTIGNGVTSIGSEVFSGCSSLTSITIPNNVTSINENAFSHEYFTSIVVSNGNSTYDSRDNCNAIIETATNKLIVGCQNTTIPNTVTSIGERAFQSCRSLTSITIPDSVTSIGESAFTSCSGLTSVTIPNSVTSIGNYAFNGCYNLTSIIIGSGVTSIGTYAFQQISNLTSITSLATTAPTITNTTFQNVKKSGTLYVPTGSIGYNTWMGTGNYYLGKYSWRKVEQ